MNIKSFSLPKLTFYTLITLLAFSCAKQPETIVVDEDPTASTGEQTPSDTTASASDADFRKLVIGELNPVPTLDPLFASNASTQRVIQLLYEGLVKYNKEGNVVPALARKWEAGNDSLSYTFTLRNDVFYHDSDIFGSGIGRKVLASDIKFAFERMARVDVPDNAANLFMNIRGFDPFYQEQHNIFNPKFRQLNGISGITASNDSTVIFDLAESDRYFLEKLASPFAVIYPREAARNSRGFLPIGTGPFKHSQQRGDSVYIFSKNEKYWIDSGNNATPRLDRVDVIVNQNETELFKALANRDVHLLPELGPSTLVSILDRNGNLNIGYDNLFVYGKTEGKFHYGIDYYPGSRSSKNRVNTTLLQVDFSNLFSDLPGNLVHFNSRISVDENTEDDISPIENLKITYTDDPYLVRVIKEISQNLNDTSTSLQMYHIRTPNRNTELSWSLKMPYFSPDVVDTTGASGLVSDSKQPQPNRLLSFSVTHTYLYNNQISNLSFNRYPWWIDLRQVTIPEFESLSR